MDTSQSAAWTKNVRLEDVINFKPDNVMPPDAWVGHIPFANWVVRELKPKRLVELGTHSGNSYFAFCQAIHEAKLPTEAYSVDTWMGDEHSGYYGEDIYQHVHRVNEKYQRFSKLLRMTFDEASYEFEDSSIDLLHIDGLHTYDAISHDFNTWLPKMTKKGLILIHDTNVFREGFGVHKFWSEIKSQFASLEFFHSNGLGIISLDASSRSVLPDDINLSSDMRSLFENLSSKEIRSFERDSLLRERDSLLRERDSLLRERDSLLKSKSWLITRPLRSLVRPFG